MSAERAGEYSPWRRKERVKVFCGYCRNFGREQGQALITREGMIVVETGRGRGIRGLDTVYLRGKEIIKKRREIRA